MRILFVMDPAETMTADKDTTFAFIRGAMARGHECLHCLPRELSNEGRDVFARARSVKVSAQKPHVTLGADERVELAQLDAVFIRQNYHDLYDKFMGPADVPAFNRKVFAALKPGGVYVVLDHVAPPGSGLAAPERLHRIDPELVKQEVTAAGFVFDGESKVLANAGDDHTKMVLETGILGQTDQFLLRFKKPKK